MTLDELRQLYQQAADSSSVCDKLYKMLDNQQTEDYPVLLGYKGAVQAIRAKHSFLPHIKLSRFMDGAAIIDRAIVKDSESIELRFLRFTIQVNSPALLNYKRNISEDKQLLTKGLPLIEDDPGLVKAVATALQESQAATEEDRALAEKYL
ncbi:hypothetical protein [uncultured Microscilla sp.]|uniref:hypothetical protein n=1 Tax=uncultured Microscilla sp. TaxID=432653 RepID=UPI00260F2878|nr:hypothetical protein [uncultured Microscilla sp.]